MACAIGLNDGRIRNYRFEQSSMARYWGAETHFGEASDERRNKTVRGRPDPEAAALIEIKPEGPTAANFVS